MNTVHVNASRSYDVLIGSGLLDTLGSYVAPMKKANKVCIVSETNVWALYGARAKESLEDAGLEVTEFVFPAGEQFKNAAIYLDLLYYLADNQITRTDLIIALGGGVVGDLAGFAAATYMRGIPFIQIPTTLLAMVDSSVGGKTAIDLPVGKNLVGAFYQPVLVLCDTDCLNTLPEEVLRDGCAEVIKYGVLYDPALFDHLSECGLGFDREMVITRCVELKRDVVAEDEFDTGARMKLNLGHTIGHGAEAQSHFEISHGKGVAIGMAIVSRAGAACGICECSAKDAILDILCKFGLPVSCAYSAESLYRAALSDKKRSGGMVNLIIPERIGFCRIEPTPVEKIQSFIEAGL